MPRGSTLKWATKRVRCEFDVMFGALSKLQFAFSGQMS